MFSRFMILRHDAFVPFLLIDEAADTAANEGRVGPGSFHGQMALRTGKILIEKIGEGLCILIQSLT